MNIKLPAMYDVSVWDPIADFTKLVPRPLAVAVKATEGSIVIDKTFAGHWAGMAQNNIFRLAYHFNRISASATGQANLFLDTVTKGGVKPKDVFVLDVEEAGTSASQIIAWLDVVEARYSNLIMIYSRKNLLDPIAMTAAQKTRLKKYPVWTAGYPENPDIYIVPPSFYIPDQTKWGPVWAWQYSEHGVVTGIPGNVDLDWMSPALINHFGAPPVPPPTLPNGDNMIYVNKVTTGGLNGRSTPDSSISNVVISFVQNDLLICDQQKTAGGASWRRVRSCIRNGVNVPLPTGEIWASDGSAGTLQGELASFDAGLDVAGLSVHTSLSLVFTDGNGAVIGTKGAENVELA